MNNFHKQGVGGVGQTVFILLFRNFKACQTNHISLILSFKGGLPHVLGVLLKIWILDGCCDDLPCFVAFWFCREIYGNKSE